MIKLNPEDGIRTEEYCEELNRTGYILYDRNEAINSLNFMRSRSMTLANRALYVMKLHSGGRYFSLDKESIFNYLTRIEYCPQSFFYPKKRSSFSLEIKGVLEKLYNNGKAREFLELYMEHRSKKKKSETLNSVLRQCTIEMDKDRSGKQLYRMPFTAKRQVNNRFAYSNIDIISQIPKEVCGTIGVEDGYFLAWGDFAQSDFRIAYNYFIRSEENDAIMNKYDDKYEALARIVSKTLGNEFDLEEFKEQRQVYKKLTLATMYGTRNSPVPEEQAFISTFSQFLNKCPKYVEYYKRLTDHLQMKSPIRVSSYFGNEEYIPYNYMNQNTTLYEALNSPIQSGTSEIVIQTVMSILDLAAKCGLSRDQFGVYFVRHDEPIFRIRNDAKEFLWILKQHSTVLVDNWSPLAMDFGIGYRYKHEDADLMAEAEEYYKQHATDITTFEVSHAVESEFYPVKPLCMLTVHWIKLEHNTIVTFYQPSTQKALFSIFETTDDEEIIKNVRIKIKDAEANISKEYQNAIVVSNFYEGDDFYGNTHVIYKYEVSQLMTPVVRLCKGMAAMYCKKYGIVAPEGCNEAISEFPEKLELLITED